MEEWEMTKQKKNEWPTIHREGGFPRAGKKELIQRKKAERKAVKTGG